MANPKHNAITESRNTRFGVVPDKKKRSTRLPVVSIVEYKPTIEFLIHTTSRRNRSFYFSLSRRSEFILEKAPLSASMRMNRRISSLVCAPP